MRTGKIIGNVSKRKPLAHWEIAARESLGVASDMPRKNFKKVVENIVTPKKEVIVKPKYTNSFPVEDVFTNWDTGETVVYKHNIGLL